MDFELIYVLKDLENKALLADCIGKYDRKILGLQKGKYYRKLIRKIIRS